MIASVQTNSPAERAGLAYGMHITHLNDEPLHDVIDWQWRADDTIVQLTVEEREQAAPGEQLPAKNVVTLTMKRKPGEEWGIEFAEPVFDGVRTCINNCCFCFMKMLPPNMRSTLYVHDDDYRLSFLQGNFVTLTNCDEADVARIIEQHLSPLNVSLHAIDTQIREQLMGRNHARGLEVLETLLAAHIEVHAQIVLVPGINDGGALNRTLSWVAQHPGITACGIVPYGYTRYAALQSSFSAEECYILCEQLRDLAPRIQLADEFFLRAYEYASIAKDAPSHAHEQTSVASLHAPSPVTYIPPASYYGDFPLIEDGIGMVRMFLNTPTASTNFNSLAPGDVLVSGTSFAPILRERLPQLPNIELVAIENRFFGGNVNVTGLLTARDVIEQLRERGFGLSAAGKSRSAQSANTAGDSGRATNEGRRVFLPKAMFNDNGLTLDNMSVSEIAHALECEVRIT